MIPNRLVSASAAGMFCLAGVFGVASSARATIVTTYNNTITPIVGSGNSSGGWTTATGGGLALSLRAQYNNTVPNPPSDLTPNNGAGPFIFPTGTSTRATWDFWFDVNSASALPSSDSVLLTINSSLGGAPVSIPVKLILDNGIQGNEFQNSEDIGFSFIGYNPSLAATYGFTLTVKDASGNTVDSVDMTVINGAAPVPEPTTIVAGALLLVPLSAGAVRTLRKRLAA